MMIGRVVTQENVMALLDRAALDTGLRKRLVAATSVDAFADLADSIGLSLRPSVIPDELTDPELDNMPSAGTDRTCRGTTDCCPGTNRTCRGTTDCCR